MSNIPNADERISRILGQKQGHTITRTDGTEPLPSNNIVGKGQVSANVAPPTLAQAQAAREAERSGIVDTITMVDPTIAQQDEVTIGDRVIIRPSGLVGFEKAFTRNAADHEVYLDGERVLGLDNILRTIFDALKEQQAKPKGKAK
jgi:hypothetical protein